jgi:uncharacterized protein DUF6916
VTEPGWITFDQFSGRLGESFEISVDGGPPIRTELTEAVESGEPGGVGPDGRQRLQFSLVFRGPLDPALPQATYGVDHGELGRLELFLVPIGPDGTGMRYQAVFA